jgi:hypothetical protein
MSNLADELGRDYASAWRPNPGDILVGEIVDLSEREGFDGELYPIVTVRKTDGVELAFHAFHTVAQNELARLRPSVGTEIGIRYKGLVKPDGGRGSTTRITTSRCAWRGWACLSAGSWRSFGSGRTRRSRGLEPRPNNAIGRRARVRRAATRCGFGRT